MTAALAVLAFGLTATPAVAADSQASAADLRTREGPAVD
jgi:hypothetical protein